MPDFDEIGQPSAEILAKFDTILHEIQNSNIYIYGWCDDYIFYRSYLDTDNWWSSIYDTMSHYILLQNGHTWKLCIRFQLWYIQTYPEICMVQLLKAHRQKWACWYIFKTLLPENLTFVDTWYGKKITPSTMKPYSKKYQQGIPLGNLWLEWGCKLKKLNWNRRIIHREVYIFSSILDGRFRNHNIKVRTEGERNQWTSLLWRWYIWNHFIREGKSINLQRSLLFDLPPQEDIASWHKI